MRRISLAVIALATLALGVTQSVSVGAPAQHDTPLPHQASTQPSEQEMRQAFETFLTTLVSGTLALVAETGGQDAVRAVQQKGHDRFEILSFHKIGCMPAPGAAGHRCSFTAEIAVAGGTLQRAMTGHFVARPGGIAFAEAN